jgi:hypothetical protein
MKPTLSRALSTVTTISDEILGEATCFGKRPLGRLLDEYLIFFQGLPDGPLDGAGGDGGAGDHIDHVVSPIAVGHINGRQIDTSELLVEEMRIRP